MLQFYIGNLLMIGITKGNINKLTEGKPIYFEIKGKEPIKKMAIIYGESKISILEELQRTGMQVPHWMWESARNDPS